MTLDSLVELGYGMCCSLADIRGHVSDSVLDGEHHDRHDDRHTDAGQHSQRTSTDQLVGVLQGVGESDLCLWVVEQLFIIGVVSLERNHCIQI